MSGLDMSHGIPRGRPSRKMPAPFQRPSVALGPRGDDERRAWQWIAPAALREGDVVPGLGLIHRVRELVYAPTYQSGMPAKEIANAILWAVLIDAGVPESQQYELDASEQIWAYCRVQQ